MDLINELAYILSKKKPSEFNSLLPVDSKVRQLYDLVVHEQIESDNDAAHKIYNSTKADKKYLMLKRNLVQRLSELVFILDYIEEFEDNYTNIQFAVEKELNIAEKLILENVYHNPTKIIARVEQTAEKYFLIDLQISAAKKFRSIYSLKGFPIETQQYDEKVKKLSKHQQYFTEAKGMWEILYSKTKYTIAKIPEFVFEAYHYSETLRKWIKEYDSPFLKLFYYRINIIKFDQQNDFEKVLENINKLHKLITDFHFVKSKSILLEINLAYAQYYRNIKDLKNAKLFLSKSLELSDYRAFNKFNVQQLNFDVQIKLQEYDSALHILKDIYEIPQYEFLDEYDKSAWLIREAYLYFIFTATNQLNKLKNLQNIFQEFDLSKFLEKTKKSTKDKYGYNIVLLIIRLLFLAKENIEEIDNEGNNMLIYHHRYLKELNSIRTAEFFKSLGKVASKGFEKEYMLERREKSLNRFESFLPKIYDIFEIIPYEDFWAMIPEFIKTK